MSPAQMLACLHPLAKRRDMSDQAPTRKAALILAGFFLFEGAFALPPLLLHTTLFLRYLGFTPGSHDPDPTGWFLAGVVAAGFIGICSRLPSVRETLVRASWLKLLALGVAVVAGILEEWVFRGMLMDWAARRGIGDGPQILLSALAFGLAHGIWGFFRGSVRAGMGATVATGAMGAALSLVYLASGRSLAPCIAAHFLINAFAEPGLVLAAIRGEMGGGPPTSRTSGSVS
jgi:uncharacterized protein